MSKVPLPLLAQYWEQFVKSDHVNSQVSQNEIDAASEAAIEAIVQAGFDSRDSDQLGAEMGEDVQTLLTLAFIRCPELMDVFASGGGTDYVPADLMVDEVDHD